MAATCDELPSSLAGLSREAAQHLHQAGVNYSENEVAEHHLAEALRLAPDHLAVQVGYYRYLFYKGRLEEALRQLDICLDGCVQQSGLPRDWQTAHRDDADFGNYDSLCPRFYLFALKAHGYIQMRLGRQEQGRIAILKVLELDPSDKVGAKVLLDVLDRQGLDDYE
jgi:tetratricopeptide (TPR) repeat protein